MLPTMFDEAQLTYSEISEIIYKGTNEDEE
jgi:hypothetical protein